MATENRETSVSTEAKQAGNSDNVNESGASKALGEKDAKSNNLGEGNIETIEINDNDDTAKGEENVKEPASEVIEIEDEEKGEILPENEDEDVPGDFFDDFLKEDFMAGLDIVDEDDEIDEEKQKRGWTDEKKQNNKHIEEPKKVSKKKKKIAVEASLTPPKPETKKTLKNLKHDEELKKLDEELERMRKTKIGKKQKVKNPIDVDEFDIRRDPEKTRRDIQRNKEKCEKDREKKILEEKLGLVETGLVPPGMEMEVDLEEIKRQERIERNRPPGDLRERIRSLRSKSRERERRNKSEEKTVREISTKRKRTPSPRKKDVVSPKPVRKERSPPPRREPPRRWRPSLETNNSPPNDKRPSPRRRSPPRRRSRSPRRSPPFRRQINRVPSSPPRRRRRSRSRSRPLRRDEKRSFLEELVEKLNAPRQEPPRPYIPPLMAPTVPQAYYQPQAQPLQPTPVNNTYDPYDASFFIGSSAVGQEFAGAQFGGAGGNSWDGGPQAQVKSKEEVSKLFQDKKIRLTEFLAMTKKQGEPLPSPTQLKDKIKVLQRCQEALRVVESLEPTRSAGRLVVRKTDAYEPSVDRTRSPLLRYPEIRLPFTTPSTADDRELTFTRHCQQLLRAIGVADPLVVTPDEVASVRVPPKPLLVKSTQTEAVESRSTGVQCGEPKATFSVGTQATDADFYEMIPKTQSLATLTPAQLLGKPAKVTQDSLVKSLESFMALRPGTEAWGGQVQAVAPPPPPAPPSLLDLPFGGARAAPYQAGQARFGAYRKF